MFAGGSARFERARFKQSSGGGIGRGHGVQRGPTHGVGESRSPGVSAHDGCSIGQARVGEIRAKRLPSVVIAFVEGAVFGAARERLDAERTAAGEQVKDTEGREHSGQSEASAEDVEQRLFRAVGEGPRGVSARGREVGPFSIAGDDAHRDEAPTGKAGRIIRTGTLMPTGHPVDVRDIMIRDLRTLLEGWDFEPGKISVRKIIGRDRREKIQARVDLGVMQFEVEGRPDGARPNDSTSLLELHERRLADHIRRNGDDEEFVLTTEECQELRHETYLFHQRFVALFVLEEYEGVERDTEHALRAIDLCSQYAVRAEDRAALGSYRNYVVMMNVRARALRASANGAHEAALAIAKAGITLLCKQGEDEEACGGEEGDGTGIARDEDERREPTGEIELLEDLCDDLIERMPEDALPRLNAELARALADEDYECAAKIRDKIAACARSAES